MGAALLKKPETVEEILSTLVKNISKPVTCKVRLLDNFEDTIDLLKRIEKTGVAAVAVHGRYVSQRSSVPAHNEILKKVVESVKIPVIVNGGSLDIQNYEDILKFKESTNGAGVMVARAAQWNPSVFRRNGPLPLDDVIRDFLKISVDFNSSFESVKYAIMQMMREDFSSDIADKLVHSRSVQYICELWNVKDYFDSVESKRKLTSSDYKKRLHVEEEELGNLKKRKVDLRAKIPLDFDPKKNPKDALNGYLSRNKKKLPEYKTDFDNESKSYRTTILYNDTTYTTAELYPSKKIAEHATALACILDLSIPFEFQTRISNNDKK